MLPLDLEAWIDAADGALHLVGPLASPGAAALCAALLRARRRGLSVQVTLVEGHPEPDAYDGLAALLAAGAALRQVPACALPWLAPGLWVPGGDGWARLSGRGPWVPVAPASAAQAFDLSRLPDLDPSPLDAPRLAEGFGASEAYFAFGSNMSAAQMRARCPSACHAEVAVLLDHALTFDHPGAYRPGGVASVQPRPGARVYGVLWRMTAADLAHLDELERSYDRYAVEVRALDGGVTRAWTYRTTPQGHFPPDRAYVERLVAGAREHGLPATWVQHLEASAPAGSHREPRGTNATAEPERTPVKLYYHPNSQPSRTTLAVAKHLGLEVETEVVDLLKGGQRAPEYLAVNPNGKVPALADGDLKLWESSAIQLYLCRQASGQTLWPEDAAAQADVARWQAWAGTTWNRPLGLLTWNLLFVSKVMGKDPDEQQVAEGRTLFAAAAPILEAHLDGREWIVGEALTLADFACASMLTYHHLIGVPMDEYPNIAAWYGRVEALDCWQATVPPSPGGQG